jgi:ATP-dependent DNA helicase RecQ
VALGDIAILARTHRSLEPLRALCDIEELRYEVLTREGARAQLSLMQSREGWCIADLLRARKSELVSVAAIRRWLRFQAVRAPRNPYWEDVADAVAGVAEVAGATKVPAAEVMDGLYEAAAESRRSGHPSALKLMTAHGAKGLEFRHVIVMDCADWRWSGEDERRLLYVSMTRAQETLTVMRAEGGRNPYLIDMGTVDGVVDLLPATRPQMRQDINRRYVTLGPADMDIGFAGRFGAHDPVHWRIARLGYGDEVIVKGRQVTDVDGAVVGKLASKTTPPAEAERGTVSGVLVRTRDQTAPEYLAALKTVRWETVLVELATQVIDAGNDASGRHIAPVSRS